MKFFVDTADVDEIKALLETGLLDGVTTNPSLIAKSGRNILEVLEEICEMVPGPVSGEVTATDAPTMIKKAKSSPRSRQILPSNCRSHLMASKPATRSASRASKPTSPSVFLRLRRCSRPKPAQPSYRLSLAALMTLARTAWI